MSSQVSHVVHTDVFRGLKAAQLSSLGETQKYGVDLEPAHETTLPALKWAGGSLAGRNKGQTLILLH